MSYHVELAKTLPPRLLRFFERFPPPSLLPAKSKPTPPSIATAFSTPPSDPNAVTNESTIAEAPSSKPRTFTYPHKTPSSAEQSLPYANPFLPVKSHLTGRWRGPTYGLRQQASLVKLATQHGVLDLLPWTIKKPGEKEKRRVENGLQVKGTGVGEKVKGKMWERTLKGKLEKRRKAMEGMSALVHEWKQKGHGRGWKKWPSGRAKK